MFFDCIYCDLNLHLNPSGKKNINTLKGLYDGICRSGRDDSSASDDGDRTGDRETVTFILGGCPTTSSMQLAALNPLNSGLVSPATASAILASVSSNSHLQQQQQYGHHQAPSLQQFHHGSSSSNSLNHSSSVSSTTPSSPLSSPPMVAFGQAASNINDR